MDKNEANDTLRYAIKTLRGEAFRARPGILLAHAIMAKDRLNEAGFWWQADKLDIWISRAHRGDFTPPAGGGPPSGGRDSH